MVQAITGFRPYVSTVPSVTQQQRVNAIKLERNEVTDDLRNGKISDMQAMSKKTALDSKLTDAKASAPKSRYVSEPVTTQKAKPTIKGKIPASLQAIDRQFKGKELSAVEKLKLVENQAKQVAVSNMIHHGLRVV